MAPPLRARLCATIALALAVAAGAGCYRRADVGPPPLDDLLAEHFRAPPPAAAESAAGPVRLDEESAVQMALERSPELRAERAKLAVADARVAEADQLKNPELRISDIRADEYLHSDPRLQLGLRFPIERPGTLSARVDAARLEAAEEQSALAERERELAGRVRVLVARLAFARADRGLLGEQIVLSARVAETHRKALETHDVTRKDAALARLDEVTLRDELLRVNGRIARIEAELRRWLGLPADTALEPISADAYADDETGEALDRESVYRRVLEHHPALKAASLRRARAEARAYVARAERWPWFDFAEVSYNFRRGTDGPAVGFTFALDVPLLSLNSGEIATREAQIRRARADEDAAAHRVLARASAAVDSVEAARRRVAYAKAELLPAAEERARGAEEARARGDTDLDEAVRAGDKLLRERRRVLETRLELREARIELEMLTGE